MGLVESQKSELEFLKREQELEKYDIMELLLKGSDLLLVENAETIQYLHKLSLKEA